MLKGVCKVNATSKALLLFRDLIRKSTSSIDSFSLLYIINACTRNSSRHEGRQFITLVVKLGYMHIIFIQTSLINYYSAVANLADAHQMFDECPEMQMKNLDPDQVTLTVALSACADLGALDMDIETAKKTFDSIKEKDVTTWTSMITGYAIHGQAKEALALFTAMTDSKIHTKIVPNEVTFVGVLMACSHVAMVDEGKRYFNSMIHDYKLKPRFAHFGCMVDLLCERAGCLQDAKDFILKMPMKPNAVLWRTLLGACSNCGDIELAEEARARLIEFEENLAGVMMLLWVIYMHLGEYGIRKKLQETGLTRGEFLVVARLRLEVK
ncbi:hypothetical protein E3N88_10558 [Mikania micrantha]|uniref:Pentacotripeptide-repeat region of PRORP domain-containing protein n=1 Tax=Mikania micrantha TaxID=192012 RepID=A0A5N6PD76_9ASTR|nr:hypothetical protein E3N88_10558 [Mikania micrantha]